MSEVLEVVVMLAGFRLRLFFFGWLGYFGWLGIFC